MRVDAKEKISAITQPGSSVPRAKKGLAPGPFWLRIVAYNRLGLPTLIALAMSTTPLVFDGDGNVHYMLEAIIVRYKRAGVKDGLLGFTRQRRPGAVAQVVFINDKGYFVERHGGLQPSPDPAWSHRALFHCCGPDQNIRPATTVG